MFEQQNFWFIIVGGEPANVMRRNEAIHFFYYDSVEQGWVNDNHLIDYVYGPDASRRDARPITREEALRFLADEKGYRHGIDDRELPFKQGQGHYTVDHLARALLDAADPSYARQADSIALAEVLWRALGYTSNPADRAGEGPSVARFMAGELIESIRTGVDRFAGMIEGSGVIVEIYRNHPAELLSDDPLVKREAFVAGMRKCLVAILPDVEDRFVSRDAVKKTLSSGAESPRFETDTRPIASYGNAHVVLGEVFAADPQVRAGFASRIERYDRADDPRNPWRTGDTGDSSWGIQNELHQTINLAAETGERARSAIRIVREALELSA